MALQKIKFQTNITVEVSLKFAEGKLCDSQFGDPQYMFTTTNDEVFFVAEKVAQKIHGLRLKPREPFEITKAEVDYGNGRKGIEWQVNKVGFAPGEEAAADVAASAPVAAATRNGNGNHNSSNGNGSKPNGTNGNGNGNGHKPTAVVEMTDEDPRPKVLQPWAAFLLQQANQVIDVYALALKRAGEQHGGTVRGEDVRSIVLSAFINVSKNGATHVA